jgi:hypothetical protein
MKTTLLVLTLATRSDCSGNSQDTITNDIDTTVSFSSPTVISATTSLESSGPITLIPTPSLTDDDYSIRRLAISPDDTLLTLKSYKNGTSAVSLDLYNLGIDTLTPLGRRDEFVSAALNAETTSLVYVVDCMAYLQTDSESTEPLLLNAFLKTDACVGTASLDIAADTVLMLVSPGRVTDSGVLIFDNDRGSESYFVTYTRSNNRVVSLAKADVSLNDEALDAMDWQMSVPRLSNDGSLMVFHALFQHNASSGTGNPIIATFAIDTDTSNTTIIGKREYSDLTLCPRCTQNPFMEPVISGNSRYVFFQQANDDVDGVSSKENPGLYRYDLTTGNTADLAITHAASALVSNTQGNRFAYVSGNDVMVRYLDSNEEINLTPAMRFCSQDPCEIIAHYFVHQQPIKMNTEGTVLFVSAQVGPTENITSDYFHEQQLFDLDLREMKRLVPNQDFEAYVASSDGERVYFAGEADNLAPGDNDGAVNLFYIERTQ